MTARFPHKQSSVIPSLAPPTLRLLLHLKTTHLRIRVLASNAPGMVYAGAKGETLEAVHVKLLTLEMIAAFHLHPKLAVRKLA